MITFLVCNVKDFKFFWNCAYCSNCNNGFVCNLS